VWQKKLLKDKPPAVSKKSLMGSQSTMSSGVNHAVQSESTQVNGLRVCLCVYWHSGLVYACEGERDTIDSTHIKLCVRWL
jgi:hypothetical protein